MEISSHILLSTFGGIITAVAYIPYAKMIWSGKGKPAKATWIIWTFLGLIILSGMAAKGTLNGQIISTVFGDAFIAILALRFGRNGWTLTDKLCLAGAGFAIILWQLTGDATIGILMSLLTLVFGAIPTFQNGWHHPEHENHIAWILFWIGGVIAILAIPRWSLADAAQPITLAFMQNAMIYALFIRSQKNHNRIKR